MDVPDRIAEPALHVLARIAREKLQIFVHRARNDVEVQALGLARLLVHEQSQRFRAGIGEPVVDRQAIALRLRNLLALFVEKQFVIETLRRDAAEGAHNIARQLHRIDEILAGHFIIHVERIPAHRPVRLPLQLHMSAGDRRFKPLAGVGIGPANRARLHVHRIERHLHDDPGVGMHRQEGRIGRGAFLAQRGQHDRLHSVKAFQHVQQGRVETARGVIVGRGREFIFKAELVEERAQHGVVVRGERLELAEGIGDARQRLAQMCAQHVAIGHIVGHLAQTVHVIRKRQQARRDPVVRQHAERMAHHGRARDFTKSPDMGQARRTIAGLEQHALLAGALDALDKFARLLEGPGGCLGRGVEEFGRHGLKNLVRDCRHAGTARGRGGTLESAGLCVKWRDQSGARKCFESFRPCA